MEIDKNHLEYQFLARRQQAVIKKLEENFKKLKYEVVFLLVLFPDISILK